MTLVEHGGTGDPYDVPGLWFFRNAAYDYVASARWVEEVSSDTGIHRGGTRTQMIRVLCAESPILDLLENWARSQLSQGAETVALYRTWPLQDQKGRDNAFLKIFRAI